MAFDDITNWTSGYTISSGDTVSNGTTTFSSKNAEDVAFLIQKILTAIDYIDAN